MREIVRAASDADFLAALPGLAGFSARNSLVVGLFQGRFAVGAFRLDLPERRRTADFREIAEFVVAVASRSIGVDRVCPVVYTDETFEARHGIPWSGFADDVASRIRRSGLCLTGFFCVAADGWGDYLRRRPATRRPLAEIEGSALFAAVEPLTDRELIPEIGDRERAAFRSAYESVEETDDVGEALERCLAAEQVGARALARIALTLRSPSHRDRCTLQIAFGELVGEVVAQQDDAYRDLQRRRGVSMDDVVRDELGSGRLRHDDEIHGLYLGRGRIRPDPDRMAAGIGLLTRMVACLDDEDRPSPLCMLAWLSWASGLGTLAARYLDLAARIDGGYPMTGLLLTLTRHVPIPEWALPQG